MHVFLKKGSKNHFKDFIFSLLSVNAELSEKNDGDEKLMKEIEVFVETLKSKNRKIMNVKEI